MAINDAPLATGDTASTSEDSATSIPVLENDSDIDNASLSIADVGTPDLGTAVISGTRLLYSPTQDFFGSDVFTYTITDGLLFDTAAIMVSITGVNDAPIAMEDEYLADQETPLVISTPGVLVNDSDVEGDDLTATLIGQPDYGSLQLGIDGSFSYTPEDGFTGTDQFIYYASDGVASSKETVVKITVEAAPQLPPGMMVFLPFIFHQAAIDDGN